MLGSDDGFYKGMYESQKENRLSNDQHARCNHYLMNLKRRAKDKGYEFDLDFAWLWSKWERGVCEITGIHFDFSRYDVKKKGVQNPHQPSVDRIDSSKGYTKDNCHVVVYMYNSAKSMFTHEDIVRFCRAVLIAEAANKQKIKNKSLTEAI